MKHLITLLLLALSINSNAQSCNGSSAGISGYTIPVYAVIERLSNGTPDTLCWYMNRDEIIAYVATAAGGGADSTIFATQYQVDTAKTNLRAGLLLHAVVPVSSAEILALFTSPKQLLPAPGAGNIIKVLSIAVKLNFVSAQYATATAMNIYENASFLMFPAINGPLASTSTGYYLLERSGTNAGAFTQVLVENAPLMLSVNGGADPTAGGGDLIFYIDYEILTP